MGPKTYPGRKLLIASVGVATINYLVTGCGDMNHETVANLMAPMSSAGDWSSLGGNGGNGGGGGTVQLGTAGNAGTSGSAEAGAAGQKTG